MAKKKESKETAIKTVLIDGKDAKRVAKAQNTKQVMANQLEEIQIALKAQDQAISLILEDYAGKGERATNYDVSTNLLTLQKFKEAK